MLTFKIQGQQLQIEQVYYIDARFLIGEHPDTKIPCLFIRQGEPIPFLALQRVGLVINSVTKEYKGIMYYELKEGKDGSEYSKKIIQLRGELGYKGVEDKLGGDVVSQGVGKTP